MNTEQLSKIYQIPYANLFRNKNVQVYWVSDLGPMSHIQRRI